MFLLQLLGAGYSVCYECSYRSCTFCTWTKEDLIWLEPDPRDSLGLFRAKGTIETEIDDDDNDDVDRLDDGDDGDDDGDGDGDDECEEEEEEENNDDDDDYDDKMMIR